MANLIMKISGLKILTTSKVESINIEENGTYAPPTGVVGFNPVTVNVEPPLQEKTTTQNGEVVADPEYYGLSKVNVDVPAPPLSKRKITVNGIYNASNEGLNGYSEVDVDVPENSVEEESSITFYDYDGAVLRRINLDQLPITELDLPTPPPHEYLIFNKWTHTLAEINEAETGLNIGAIYDTVGGKTYAFIEVNDSTGYSVPLNITKTGADTTLSTKVFDTDSETEVIDIVDTSVGVISHTLYLPNTPKKYRVEVYVTEGSGTYTLGGGSGAFAFIGGNNQNYRNTLLKVFVGNNNVTSIGNSAFQSCYSLTNATIPNSVTSIGSSAFVSCRSLTSIIIPNSVTSLGTSAVAYCYSLTSAIIPNSVRSMGAYVFQSCCSLTSIIIPNNVTSLGTGIFHGCNLLTNIIIPNSVTSLGTQLFNACFALTNMVIPNSVISLGNQAFYQCYSLTSIIIPNSVTSLGASAVAYCYSLTSAIIPNSVKSIGASAFSNCFALTNLTIPNSVTSLGTQAFQNCYSLKTIDMTEFDVVLPLPNINVFTDIPVIFKIKVKQSMVNAYKTATNWSVYATNIVGVEV